MTAHLSGECIWRTSPIPWLSVALQGPGRRRSFRKLSKAYLPAKNYTFIARGRRWTASRPFWSPRTGYTGEDGFEIYCGSADAPALWNKLLTAGKDGALPCGLGARDTLRLEAGMPLYGHELSRRDQPL